MIHIKDALDKYLRLRRGLGFKLQDEETLLPQFLQFLYERGVPYITTTLALQWATQPQNCLPAYWRSRLSMVRQFARFHSTLDNRTEVSPTGLLPFIYRRKNPYIYKDAEISSLIEAATHLPSPSGLRSATYSTLFGLLAVTGMRISEPIALDIHDVDLIRGILTIRDTKFTKSRLLPLHPSTCEALIKYTKFRDEIAPITASQSFFISEKGSRLTHYSVRYTFVKISHEIGLRKPGEHHGPRLHDIRHTFAVKTLLKWYKEGVDVESHIPELATYLGHTHINDTYWYLSAVPELLNLAMMRLDKIQGRLF
jgi:integrase